MDVIDLKSKTKKILIVNHFGSNKGDAAILIGLVNSIRHLDLKVSLSIVSSCPEIDAKYLAHTRLRLLPRIYRQREETGENVIKWIYGVLLWFLQSMTWALLKRYDRDMKFCFDHTKREILKEYDEADVIISCGGGYFNDSYSSMILAPLHEIAIGIIMRKRVYLCAQSIGPFTKKLWRLIASTVLNKVDLITLREPISKDILLRNLAVRKPISYVTSDAAFLLTPEKEERVQEILFREGILLNACPIVGITLNDWHYPQARDPRSKHEEYKKTMAQVADYLAQNLNAAVVFVPMNAQYTFYDERRLATDIIQKMTFKKSAKILEGEYTPQEILGTIGKMDFLIGTRFHSVIFALIKNVPAVAIMYEHKALGIMKMLGLEKYVCDINSLDPDDLIAKINDLVEERILFERTTRQKVIILQRLASLNSKLAMLMLELTTTAKNRVEMSSLKLDGDEVELLRRFN